MQLQSTSFKCYGEMTLFIFKQLPKQFVLFSDPSLLILFWDFSSLALASRSLSYPSFLFPLVFVLSLGLRTCLCVNAGIISYLSKNMFCLFFFSFVKHLFCNLPSLLAVQLLCNLNLRGLFAHQYRVGEEKANNLHNLHFKNVDI